MVKIGIDLDDTITDIRDDMIKLAIQYDKSIKGKGIVNNNSYYPGQMFDWSTSERDYFRKELLPKFVSSAKIRDGVIETLETLKEKDYKIIIITARDDKRFGNAYLKTFNWLIENKIPFDELVTSCKEKDKVCLDLKIDYFLDDDIINIDKVQKAGIKCFMIYNGYDFLRDDLDIIYNFKDLLKVLKVD